MLKFIEGIQSLCALIVLSFVFFGAMMQVFEIDFNNRWATALIFPSGVASAWICNVLCDISDYLKDNYRNGSEKKTLRD